MAFNMEQFIKTNITKGYLHGDFSEVQINIFLINYLSKGMISQDTFDELVKFMDENEPEVSSNDDQLTDEDENDSTSEE